MRMMQTISLLIGSLLWTGMLLLSINSDEKFPSVFIFFSSGFVYLCTFATALSLRDYAE